MLTEARHRSGALLALSALLSCSGCYYVHVAAGQLDMNSRREPIERMLAQPGLDGELRRRLRLAAAAREFALAELGLPDNGSYRSYADLGRPYATWNLYAAPEFSVEPHRWCYPVAGCVAYRGYFSERAATRAAARRARRGDDVWIGPSLAYSTLGHFRDPVLNTMLAQPDDELAALIFHELAHQAAWVPGDADFNEAFATVVEEEGLRRWRRRDGAQPATATGRRQLQAEAAERMAAARGRLAALYAAGEPGPALRSAKQAELRDLAAALRALGVAEPGTLNNARLAAVSTYHRCVPALRAELQRLGGDLPAFYAAMRHLGDQPEHRRRLCPAG